MFGLPATGHSALPVMTEGAALRALREHAECPITVCAAKLQAKTYLVRIGKRAPRPPWRV
ncbi:hypothetical protein D7D52_35725 [Nocardia yunnanensis]|uniref:Uncharacterized protein n=1 Tax=Nocardia yunnanensis TaxID=2382165 RepID=A0A386ZM90_9NOCA|nr:hypothetical protein D7D52_35725 [Nocardia yunnanensis]